VKKYYLFILAFFILMQNTYASESQSYCFTGAFLADQPVKKDILEFRKDYGKKPYLVMIFLGWGDFPSERTIKDVYAEDCILFLTWEPWDAQRKAGIDFNALIQGKFDSYIGKLAAMLKEIDKPVLLRFGHEMNGDWYPWSGAKIGANLYIQAYRHVKEIFNKGKAANVKWVFSINWEDLPRDNRFILYYPGSDYVDYIGIDGYNWGNSKHWSKWQSFEQIFKARYEQAAIIDKPIIISEFSSSSSGGDKQAWIKEALNSIKNMKKIKAFVIFNQDKEADWKFSPGTRAALELKKQLRGNYYKDKNTFKNSSKAL